MTKVTTGRPVLQYGDTVFAYCRDSGGTEQERSVDDQIAEIQEYAVAHGLTIAKIYADRAITGTHDRRPQFQAMIAACRESENLVAGIVVWKLNRIGRNELDRQFYLSDLRRRGYAIASVTQREIDGPLAGPIEALFAWHDEQFINDLREDVKRGLERVGPYRNHGSVPPPGYTREQVAIGIHRDGKPRNVQRWKVDAERAPAVVEAFRMYASGASMKAIHERTGIAKTYQGYKAIFNNPIYIGVVRTGEYRRQDESLRLIDNDLWEAAQKRRGSPVPIRSRDNGYLLTGLLYCGKCGHHMTGDSNRIGWQRTKSPDTVYRYYRCTSSGLGACRPKVPQEDVDNRVVQKVLSHLSEDNIADIVDELRHQAANDAVAKEIAGIDDDLVQARNGIDNLIGIGQLGGESGAKIRQRILDLEGQVSELLIRRAQLVSASQRTISPERVRLELTAARHGLESSDRPEMRQALRDLISRVILDEDRSIDIVYRGF